LIKILVEDGKGRGYVAEVNDQQKIAVRAVDIAHIEEHSNVDQKAFNVLFEGTQASGGSAEGIGAITYTGTDKLAVDQIIVVSEEPADGLTKFGIWVSSTVSGGVACTPFNLNMGSDLTSETTCIEAADSTPITVTGGTSIYTIRLKGPGTYSIDLKGALVMRRNHTLAVK